MKTVKELEKEYKENVLKACEHLENKDYTHKVDINLKGNNVEVASQFYDLLDMWHLEIQAENCWLRDYCFDLRDNNKILTIIHRRLYEKMRGNEIATEHNFKGYNAR
ncbi:MAG: hypothetical protein HAW60_05965 [Bdellovibrionales bacterium]|nr:hypothetical protein [Bdellovibrionales bacterium]